MLKIMFSSFDFSTITYEDVEEDAADAIFVDLAWENSFRSLEFL